MSLSESEIQEFIISKSANKADFAYSLGVFKNNQRLLDNFECSSMIALDFDEGITIDEAISIVKYHDLRCVIGTTFNHRREKKGVISDRFRVVFPLDFEISDSKEYSKFIADCARRYFDNKHDEACLDASRQWFGSKDIEYTNLEGKYISRVVIDEDTGKGVLSRNTVKFFEKGEGTDQFNVTLFKASKDMQENLYTKDEVVEIFEKAVESGVEGFTHAPDDNDLKAIDSAFKKPGKYGPRLIGDFESNIGNSIAYKLVVDPNIVFLENQEKDGIVTTVSKLIDGVARDREIVPREVRYCKAEFNPLMRPGGGDKDNWGVYSINPYAPPKWIADRLYKLEPGESLPSGSTLYDPEKLPEVYRRFFSCFVGGRDKSMREIVMFMAQSLIGKNRKTMVFYDAVRDTGKNIVGKILQELHGGSPYFMIKEYSMQGDKFDGEKELLRVEILNEYNPSLKQIEQLKGKTKMGSDDFISVRGMRSQAKMIRSWISQLYFTNEDTISELIHGDVKQFILPNIRQEKLTDDPDMPDTGDIHSFVVRELLHHDNISKLADYLFDLDCKSWNNTNAWKHPEHLDRLMMRRASSPVQSYIVDELAPRLEGEWLTHRELTNKIIMGGKLNGLKFEQKDLTPNRLKEFVEKSGVAVVQRSTRKSDRKCTVFFKFGGNE